VESGGFAGFLARSSSPDLNFAACEFWHPARGARRKRGGGAPRTPGHTLRGYGMRTAREGKAGTRASRIHDRSSRVRLRLRYSCKAAPALLGTRIRTRLEPSNMLELRGSERDKPMTPIRDYLTKEARRGKRDSQRAYAIAKSLGKAKRAGKAMTGPTLGTYYRAIRCLRRQIVL